MHAWVSVFQGHTHTAACTWRVHQLWGGFKRKCYHTLTHASSHQCHGLKVLILLKGFSVTYWVQKCHYTNQLGCTQLSTNIVFSQLYIDLYCSHICSVSHHRKLFYLIKSVNTSVPREQILTHSCLLHTHCTVQEHNTHGCMNTPDYRSWINSTMPVQTWCNIQGFIQSLHTVHQSEIYSEPSTKVRQVYHKICIPKNFQMKFTKRECVWVCVSFFLFSVHIF